MPPYTGTSSYLPSVGLSSSALSGQAENFLASTVQPAPVNLARGFSKHFHDLLDHPAFRQGQRFLEFGHSLLCRLARYVVSREGGYFYQDYKSGRGFWLQKGECAIRLRSLARELGITDHKLIQRWLKRMEAGGLIRLSIVQHGKKKLFTVISFLVPFVEGTPRVLPPATQSVPVPGSVEQAEIQFPPDAPRDSPAMPHAFSNQRQGHSGQSVTQSTGRMPHKEYEESKEDKTLDTNPPSSPANANPLERGGGELQETCSLEDKSELSPASRKNPEPAPKSQPKRQTAPKPEPKPKPVPEPPPPKPPRETRAEPVKDNREGVFQLPAPVQEVADEWKALGLNAATFQGYFQKASVETVQKAIDLHGLKAIQNLLKQFLGRLEADKKPKRYWPCFRNFFTLGYWREFLPDEKTNEEARPLRDKLLEALGGDSQREAHDDVVIETQSQTGGTIIRPGPTFQQAVLEDGHIAAEVARAASEFGASWSCLDFQLKLARLEFLYATHVFEPDAEGNIREVPNPNYIGDRLLEEEAPG